MKTENLRVEVPELITAEWLTGLGACVPAVEAFKVMYPAGVRPCLNVLTSSSLFDLDWLAERILTLAAWKVYCEATDAAWKVFREAEAARKVYDEAAAARKVYDEAAAAWKVYDEAKAAALLALVE